MNKALQNSPQNADSQAFIIFWFRRDLRLHDNVGLYAALSEASQTGARVAPLFIFDRSILDALEDKRDRRVEYIARRIGALREELRAHGSDIIARYGTVEEIWRDILAEFHNGETTRLVAVFTNEDYEPYARRRDAAVQNLLATRGIPMRLFKDQTIFHKDDVLTADNRPYTVFTPYSKKWKAALSEEAVQTRPSERLLSSALWRVENNDFPAPPSLADMGFIPTGEDFPAREIPRDIIARYHETRDFPAQRGTTRLSVHLRFGALSVRELVRVALELNATWLNELIWRDFYMQILWHFPHVASSAFKPDYNRIAWRNNPEEFERWKTGTTGYPIVDAGMRELNATGYMHNRVRMITASFLTKHLLIDWRWGEKYFAQKLLDFDLAANNGGWQWAAGSGCDAAPYFRIFNPTAQTQKFDPELGYIKRWAPELQSFDYPPPIVEHSFARERALQTYKQALAKDKP